MSEREGYSSIGEISDVSNFSEEEPSKVTSTTTTNQSPPSRSNLEREASKLRAKFKILREGLTDEKLAKVNQTIKDIEEGLDPKVAQELQLVEARRAERTIIAHERKRVKVDAIINDYKAKIQALQDEKRAIDLDLIESLQRPLLKKETITNNGTKGKYSIHEGGEDYYNSSPERDLERIKQSPPSTKIPKAEDNFELRDLVHSD